MKNALCFAPRRLIKASNDSLPIPLIFIEKGDDATRIAETFGISLSSNAQSWLETHKFSGRLNEILSLPGENGQIEAVLIGFGDAKSRRRDRFHGTNAASTLPEGHYALCQPENFNAENFALGWLLEGYRFSKYRDQGMPKAKLVCPEGVDVEKIHALADSEFIARDLINIPAEDMGPNALTQFAKDLAQQHGARIDIIEGSELEEQNFPLIATVGRASDETPRLIDLRWGDAGPSLTLVGKGVCYDTGGLNLKPGSSMALMKKDMGGSANVFALAHAIMSSGWNIRLRVLVPAVENNVSANAYRPGDIFRARNGLTVEINNTDAEGRLVLADALAYAAEETPDQIISMATLTGAARVAVGPDLAPFYTDSDTLAQRLADAANAHEDPVWRMPFHDPYEAKIEPGIADLDNAPAGGFAGSITAALFLRRFGGEENYTHFDIYGWNPTRANSRSKGGIGQGWRALFSALPSHLDL